MSLRVTAMEFEHVFLYRSLQRLPLDNLGLVLVRGRNKISQAADANGVGKTSLFSVLSAGWFGESLKGARGEDIACRFTQAPGRITLHHEDELGPWTLTRTFRPTSLSVTGIRGLAVNADSREVQDKLLARLGFGKQTFRNVIIFGQGNFDRFSTAPQADKIAMLDEMQGLDFKEVLSRAKQWRDGLAGSVAQLEEHTRTLEQHLAAQQGLLADLTEARQRFSATKAGDIQTVLDRQAQLESAKRGAKAQLDALLGKAFEVGKLKACWKQVQAVRVQKEQQRVVMLEADRLVSHNQEGLQGLQAHLTALLEEDACPSCRTPINDPKIKQKINAAFADDLEQWAQAVTEAEAQALAARRALDLLTVEETQLTHSLPQDFTERSLGQMEAEVSPAAQRRAQQTLTDCDMRLTAAWKELEEVKQRRWDSQSLLDAAEEAIAQAEADLLAHQKLVERTRKGQLVAEYWVEAFGDRGIRSLLFDAIAPFLNTRLAHHLIRLAAGELDIKLSSTRALKSGGTREQLTISPVWAWGGAGLLAGSGGQDRRQDLALFAAMQDLGELRSARPFPLKVWDEPADALDARGQEMFARWVEEHARMRGSGFLITHSLALEAEIRPDRVWTVVLDHSGATVIEE